MISTKDIQSTYGRIQKHITKTPLLYSQELSEVTCANVYLKMENFQITGSFKLRGMMTKILSLDKSSFAKPFVAASSGNHAAAFGYASEKFEFSGTLFLPTKVNQQKVKALEKYTKLTIFFEGNNSMETEARATNYAKEVGGVLIHPYNDIEIVKGQGTVAIEIEEQLPDVDVILVPIGGGGLAAGMASYFKDSKVQVIGCQPQNASEMYESIKADKIVPPSTLSTIADASAGGIEENAITYTICKDHLSDFEIVTEEAIKEATKLIFKHLRIIVEPTSAIPLAVIMQSKKYRGKNVALIVTGKKISNQLLKEITEDDA